MKEIRRVIPEDYHLVDESIKMEDVNNAFFNKTTLTGRVIEYYSYAKVVVVDLGNGILAKMPYDEVCLEALKVKYEDPIQVREIALKSAIRVKVIQIKDSGEIIVSRKQNIIDYYNQLKQEFDEARNNVNGKTYLFFNAQVVGLSKKSVFFDIGEGLVAICDICEISRVHITETKKWIKKGEWKNIKLKRIEKGLVWCSIKDGYPADYSALPVKSVVSVKLGEPVYENNKITGYFVEITPAIAGIADITEEVEHRDYKNLIGKYVNAYIRGYDQKRKKVKLILR